MIRFVIHYTNTNWFGIKDIKKLSTNYFEKKIKIESEHLDALQHVNNVEYVKWVQEIAGEHWMSVTGIDNTEEQFWVVHEHTIQYKKQVYLNDILKIKTYVEPYEGIRFPRVVEFYRGEEMVVRARTFWILLGKKNRPKRLDSDTLALFGL